jgi:hypothetical protein
MSTLKFYLTRCGTAWAQAPEAGVGQQARHHKTLPLASISLFRPLLRIGGRVARFFLVQNTKTWNR